MPGGPQTCESLSTALTQKCETLRQWHHLAAVMLVRHDGKLVAATAEAENAPKSRIMVKLLAERVLFVAIADAGNEQYLGWLQLPNHAWLQSVEQLLRSYVEDAGAERADRELPIVTDDDVDRLFNDPATAP